MTVDSLTKNADSAVPTAPKESNLERSWEIFRQNGLALAGLAIFIAFFFVAVLGLVLTSGSDPMFDPSLVRLQEKLKPPLSSPRLDLLSPGQAPGLGTYLFGTDNLGRDVFARMLQGSWVSLTVGFVAVGISVIIGIFMGGMAGYFGRVHIRVGDIGVGFICVLGIILIGVGLLIAGALCFLMGVPLLLMTVKGRQADKPSGVFGFLNGEAVSVDTTVMRLVDIMLCFPSFFLILTVVALLPASIYNIMVVIGLTSWMGTARFVRAEFLSLREQDFVTAARALGVGNMRIIFRHMLPNALAPVMVSATIGIATAILTEAGLSFLGFGVPPPHATWGNILSDGKNFIFDAPWLTFIPGIAILVVVLSFNLFGEGLRDALNPRLRERN